MFNLRRRAKINSEPVPGRIEPLSWFALAISLSTNCRAFLVLMRSSNTSRPTRIFARFPQADRLICRWGMGLSAMAGCSLSSDRQARPWRWVALVCVSDATRVDGGFLAH